MPLDSSRELRPAGQPIPDVMLIGFVGGTGGAAMLMREMAYALGRRGVSARLVIPAWPSTRPFVEDCRARGLDVQQTHWLEERQPRALSYLDAARVAARFRAPVVHYHLTTNVMPGRYVRPVQWLGSRPALVTLHDPYDDPPAGSPPAQRWAAAAPRLFDRVVCVSRAGAERQVRYGIPPNRVRLIYNGIDIERFSGGRGSGVRASLGLAPSTDIVLVSSRIAAQKRPLEAVHAFARIASDCPGAHLVFLGEGPLGDAVRAEAARIGLQQRVHLPGYRTDIEEWLAAASVWLLPTESEGFSLAVIEAMAARCPIVSTSCVGNDEVLVHDRNALLVPIGDVAGMAEAMRRLLRDETLRRRLGEQAGRDAQPFSLGRMMDAYLQEYVSAGWTRGASVISAAVEASRAASVRGS